MKNQGNGVTLSNDGIFIPYTAMYGVPEEEFTLFWQLAGAMFRRQVMVGEKRVEIMSEYPWSYHDV